MPGIWRLALPANEPACITHLYQLDFLTAEEVAYIIQNSESQVLITSAAKQDVVLAAAVKSCPRLKLVLVVDSDANNLPDMCRDYAEACAEHSDAPISDERLGTSMLYSSGSGTWGIIRPLPPQSPVEPLPIFQFLSQLWGYQEDMVYLSPAPLYHSAPQAAVSI